RLFFSLIIVAGVVTIFRKRWLHGFAIVLAAGIIILKWVEEIRPELALTVLNACLSLLFLGFLLAAVSVQVFGEGPVTGHRIRGAVVMYLLLGVIWAILYHVVALTIPQAFRLPEDFAGGYPDALQRQLMYFSFITLTTTGFGDITPVHPVAKMLTMFEALAGQLFLAITIARLVALAVVHQNEKP
ncbi:MAG: potassium channel family protein, partial [Desulfobaccales bacterium]